LTELTWGDFGRRQRELSADAARRARQRRAGKARAGGLRQAARSCSSKRSCFARAALGGLACRAQYPAACRSSRAQGCVPGRHPVNSLFWPEPVARASACNHHRAGVARLACRFSTGSPIAPRQARAWRKRGRLRTPRATRREVCGPVVPSGGAHPWPKAGRAPLGPPALSLGHCGFRAVRLKEPSLDGAPGSAPRPPAPGQGGCKA